jgi:cytochrome c7-like protein
MNRTLPIVLAAALVAAGCSAKAKKVEKDEKAQRPETEFVHSIHVDQGIECTDCHAGIDKATSLSQSHLPATDKCKECHEDKTAPKPAAIAPRVNFSHAKHLGQAAVKGKCDTCHKKLPEAGDPYWSPPMDICTSCHKHQTDFNEGRCRPCHVDLKGYFPERAYAHKGDWLRLHGPLARPSAESCAQCHDQTYCSQCHSPTTAAARPSIIFPEEVKRDFIHRGDYVSRHMIEAAQDPASCSRCHGKKYCESCHEQQNLTKLFAGSRVPESHEKAGWANDRASGNFHGDAARRDISSCAACHDQGADSVCVLCHQVGGAGGNPHPRKFLRKHDDDDRRNNTMCAACHHGT